MLIRNAPIDQGVRCETRNTGGDDMWRLLQAFLSAITRPLVPVPLPVSQRDDQTDSGEEVERDVGYPDL